WRGTPVHGDRAGRIFIAQNDAAVNRAVNAADIHGQTPVDEYPHVVIAEEGERFTALVLEEVAEFTREVPVASVATRCAGTESAHRHGGAARRPQGVKEVTVADRVTRKAIFAGQSRVV